MIFFFKKKKKIKNESKKKKKKERKNIINFIFIIIGRILKLNLKIIIFFLGKKKYNIKLRILVRNKDIYNKIKKKVKRIKIKKKKIRVKKK